MIHTITSTTGTKMGLDDTASLDVIQRACPRFFQDKRGSRECYSEYRGQLIVRHTVEFSDGPERRTVVYMFVTECSDKDWRLPDLFCCSVGNPVKNVREAKKLVDRIMAEKRYAYDLDAKVSVPSEENIDPFEEGFN